MSGSDRGVVKRKEAFEYASREDHLIGQFQEFAFEYNRMFEEQFPGEIDDGKWTTVRDFVQQNKPIPIAVNGDFITILGHAIFAQEIQTTGAEGKKQLVENISNHFKNYFITAVRPLPDKILDYILIRGNQSGFVHASQRNISCNLEPFFIKSNTNFFNYIINTDNSITVIETGIITDLTNPEQFADCKSLEISHMSADPAASHVENVVIKGNEEKQAKIITQTISVIRLNELNKIQHELVSDKVIILDKNLAEVARNNKKMNNGEIQERLSQSDTNESKLKITQEVEEELKKEREFYINTRQNPLDLDVQIKLLESPAKTDTDPVSDVVFRQEIVDGIRELQQEIPDDIVVNSNNNKLDKTTVNAANYNKDNSGGVLNTAQTNPSASNVKKRKSSDDRKKDLSRTVNALNVARFTNGARTSIDALKQENLRKPLVQISQELEVSAQAWFLGGGMLVTLGVVFLAIGLIPIGAALIISGIALIGVAANYANDSNKLKEFTDVQKSLSMPTNDSKRDDSQLVQGGNNIDITSKLQSQQNTPQQQKMSSNKVKLLNDRSNKSKIGCFSMFSNIFSNDSQRQQSVKDKEAFLEQSENTGERRSEYIGDRSVSKSRNV